MENSSDSFYSLNSHSQSSQQGPSQTQSSLFSTLNASSVDVDEDDVPVGSPLSGEFGGGDGGGGGEAGLTGESQASSTNNQTQDMSPSTRHSGGGERAPKRRRIDHGGSSRPGGSRETSIDLTSNDSLARHRPNHVQPNNTAGFYSSSSSSFPPTGSNHSRYLDHVLNPLQRQTRQATRDPPAAVAVASEEGIFGYRPISQTTRDSSVQTVDRTATGRSFSGGSTGGSSSGGGGDGGSSGSESDTGGLESIDLTAVNDAASLRQREELDDQERRMRREASMRLDAMKKAKEKMLQSALVQQQADEQKEGAGHGGIGAMQCVICMDNFTNMTATHCGHLFCHTCINEHLITAEMSTMPRTSLCPFCRQPIFRLARRKKEEDKKIVPLSFKVRPKEINVGEKGKQKEAEKPG